MPARTPEAEPLLTPAEVAEFSTLKTGLHANAAETSAVLAINPALVDMDRANAEFPPFPEFTVPNTGPVHTAFFFTSPGSVYWATKSGTWGDATKATPDNNWVVSPPHLMILPTDASQLEALPTDPKTGGPWVMWKGTKYAHIMVPTAAMPTSKPTAAK